MSVACVVTDVTFHYAVTTVDLLRPVSVYKHPFCVYKQDAAQSRHTHNSRDCVIKARDLMKHSDGWHCHSDVTLS